MQVFLYAIGDLAIETALNCIESLQCHQDHPRGIGRCQITMMGY